VSYPYIRELRIFSSLLLLLTSVEEMPKLDVLC
jgi:hypothetical protein